MSLSSFENAIVDGALAAFGESATYTHQDASSDIIATFTDQAVFDEEFRHNRIGRRLVSFVRESDLPQGFQAGDSLTIRGSDHSVVGVERNGAGGVTLELRAA